MSIEMTDIESAEKEEYLGLQTYDTEADYEMPSDCPDEHRGYGSGKMVNIFFNLFSFFFS